MSYPYDSKYFCRCGGLHWESLGCPLDRCPECHHEDYAHSETGCQRGTDGFFPANDKYSPVVPTDSDGRCACRVTENQLADRKARGIYHHNEREPLVPASDATAAKQTEEEVK